MRVVCILAPRFELLAAVESRRELLGRPVALAPEPGGPAIVGEVSGAAEALGIRAGMRLTEALARCPRLALVAPDPAGAASGWEAVLRRLEGIGAAIATDRAGEAFFAADGLIGIAGGHLDGVLARARRAAGVPVRIGVGPSRFCAFAAAGRGGRRRVTIVPAGAARAFLAPLSVALLSGRGEVDRDAFVSAQLVADLERLGIRTLGELAALPRAAVADRLGRPGLRAAALARGGGQPLRPRAPSPALHEELELVEPAYGPLLERALGLLIDRLLARPERRGRTLRSLRLEARLVEGGGWRREAVLRRASASAERLRLALAPRLAELPAPVERLGLRATGLGPPAVEQASLLEADRERRLERLREAVRQARAAAGGEAVLRVLDLESASPIPERRMTLTPFPELGR